MSKRPTVAPSIVGLRLQTARLLAGLSTDEAARRLGIKRPSRLTRAEHPNYPKGITPQLLTDAVQLYGVSADFLLGTGEPESDAEPPFQLFPDVVLADMERVRQRHDALMLRITQFRDESAPAWAEFQAIARETPAWAEFQALAREAIALSEHVLSADRFRISDDIRPSHASGQP
ncbi:MAG: helix-turn-helix transcriptional regulator [Zoogloea sp.]|jgi:transcriptional regulator with XRE-family HTH domain|nr:helix-turn-helix transcriptional regulator [Zoogloea sp.]